MSSATKIIFVCCQHTAFAIRNVKNLIIETCADAAAVEVHTSVPMYNTGSHTEGPEELATSLHRAFGNRVFVVNHNVPVFGPIKTAITPLWKSLGGAVGHDPFSTKRYDKYGGLELKGRPEKVFKIIFASKWHPKSPHPNPVKEFRQGDHSLDKNDQWDAFIADVTGVDVPLSPATLHSDVVVQTYLDPTLTNTETNRRAREMVSKLLNYPVGPIGCTTDLHNLLDTRQSFLQPTTAEDAYRAARRGSRGLPLIHGVVHDGEADDRRVVTLILRNNPSATVYTQVPCPYVIDFPKVLYHRGVFPDGQSTNWDAIIGADRAEGRNLLEFLCTVYPAATV